MKRLTIAVEVDVEWPSSVSTYTNDDTVEEVKARLLDEFVGLPDWYVNMVKDVRLLYTRETEE